ncbi:SlyX family protein [Noviherbaspirillum sedimenti]|uniref:SlyX family protein n=1 Tax=Noviherbaspirillum sedimenti TaxID=2320865 RepID=A0A3A3GK73_9BURK|nr:SlyX family protein [Noviherbaspirillum sedimenti]RJG02706.1 SlyX family protein [Noviherbaspirillum sedimenti]
MIENRLVEIEIKLARQEDLVDTLNQTIYRQQKKIDELEALCMALVRRMQEVRQGADEPRDPVDEIPPHY